MGETVINTWLPGHWLGRSVPIHQSHITLTKEESDVTSIVDSAILRMIFYGEDDAK